MDTERHLLGAAIRRVVALPAGALWSNRWWKTGRRDRLMNTVFGAYDGDVQLIDSSAVRVHQHAAKKTTQFT